MQAKNERYDQLVQAVRHEQLAEEKFFREITHAKTFKERIASGILWYPLEIHTVHYSIAEKIEVQVSPQYMGAGNNRNLFKVGAGVIFFINEDERRDFRGTISFLSKTVMRIILNDGTLSKDQIISNTAIGVELIYDDRPFRVMLSTLDRVKKTTDFRQIAMKQILNDENFATPTTTIDASLQIMAHLQEQLNPSQLDAIRHAVKTDLFSVIHGPPGTGKTTTLVALIATLAQKEKRILVTAPSNNAVDLLAKRLSDVGLNVLRIGNVTRIGDSIGHLCLDEKVRQHQEWQYIKQVRIEAEAAKVEASRFKRKFGPQQHRDRHGLKKESRELEKWARELEQQLTEKIISESQVVCSTLIGCAHSDIEHWTFNTAIIDEGSQALEPETWLPMLMAQRTIIAGDHLQLPPTVRSKEAEDLGLAITMLDLLKNRSDQSHLLSIQYRMNDHILSFSNKNFYEGKLTSASFVKNRCLSNDEEIVTFIDTSGCGFEEIREQGGRCLHNLGEYHILREHLIANQQLYQQGVRIGVISPYALQVNNIRHEIEQDTSFRDLHIEVNTIDGFQGQERDVIYITLVRSNERGEIGFLKDFRRLNVALTRAKMKLIIIGDMSTLASDGLYLNLAEHIEKFGTYKSAWEYMYSA